MDCRCACAEPSYGLWFGSAYGILCKLLRLLASFGSSVSTSKKEGSKAYCSCLSDFSEPQQKKLLTHRRLFEWVEQVLRQGLKAHRPEACLLFFLILFYCVGTGILQPVAIDFVGCIARSHRSPPSSVGRAFPCGCGFEPHGGCSCKWVQSMHLL